jgi:hypothetical protein
MIAIRTPEIRADISYKLSYILLNPEASTLIASPKFFFHVSIFCVFHIRMTMIDLLGISIHYMLQLVPVSRGWVRRYLFMVLRNIQQRKNMKIKLWQ